MTGKVVTGTDISLMGSILGSGNWYIELSLLDKTTGATLSNPTMTLTVSDGSTGNTSGTGTGDGRDTQ